MEFICCVLVFFLVTFTPQGSGGGKSRMEKRGANCLPTFRFVLSFVLFPLLFSLFFSFLFTQFIRQYIHCIQIRRGHVRRHYCTETAAKTWSAAHIDILGFGLSAYRHAEADTVTINTYFVHFMCRSFPLAL
jgi:hypothetical protein